jgi:hypothetical protein
MKIIAKAFIDLVKGLEAAKFDDPDDDQWVEQVVVWCLSESSEDERALLLNAAAEMANEARAQKAAESVAFYERFISRVKSHIDYEQRWDDDVV